MKNTVRFFLVFLSLSSMYHSCAQSVIQHFTIENGLPSNEVYSVHQDSFGYFWFCTDRGISRYNGYEFTNFTTADGLTNNVIFKCFEDRNSNLWFTAMDGSVTIYNREKKVFEPFAYNDWVKKKYYPQQWVHHIAFSANSNDICFVMYSNIVDDSVHFFNRNGHIKSIVGEDFFRDYSRSFTNIEFLELRTYFHRASYTSLPLSGKAKGVSSEMKNRVLKTQVAKADFIGFSPSYNLIDGEVYLSCNKGTYRITETDLMEPFFEGIASTSMIKDNQGMYWVTTQNEGVFLFSSAKIKKVSSDLRLPKGVKLTTAARIGDKVLVGTDNKKIYLLNGAGKKEMEFELKTKGIKKVPHFLFNEDSSLAFFADFELKLDNGAYTHYSRPQDEMAFIDFKIDLPDTVVTNSTWDEKYDHTWEIGMSRAARSNSYPLYEFLVRHNKYYEFTQKVSANIIYPEYLFADSSVYIPTSLGLFRIFDDERPFDEIPLGDNRVTLSDCDVLDDVILLSTKGYGVKVVFKNKVVASITQEDGLLSNMVNTLWVDIHKKQVWCGTTEGISVFSYSKDNEKITFNKIRDITKQDGLFSNYINCISASQSNVVALSNVGISIIPIGIESNQYAAPILNLLGIRQGDSTYFASSRDTKFSYDENNLEFLYEAVSNKKVSDMYRYRLITDSDTGNWEVTDSRSLRINNLAPACYIFQICARAQNTDWSLPKQLNFDIIPRFIDRWWVRLLGLVLLGGIVYVLYRRRISQVTEKSTLQVALSQLELKNSQLESKALRGQMNPHFIFNVLNSIQKLVLTMDREQANNLLTRFSKLIRSSLQHSRLDFISIEEEIQFLENYISIEQQRFPDRFSFSIEVDPRLIDEGVLLPPLMIQPICENAIKHAFVEQKGSLSVKLDLHTETTILVEIVDDGVGVANTTPREGDSLGTTIIRERLEIYRQEGQNVSLTISSANEDTTKGTKVVLKIPCQ